MLENGKASYESDAARRLATRDSLQRALEGATHESEILLTLRLRGQVDDERRVEIADRRLRLQEQLARPEARPEELLDRVRRVLEFAANAAALFDQSDGVRRRQILRAVSSNWEVEGRKCVSVAKEPFSFVEKSAPKQD